MCWNWTSISILPPSLGGGGGGGKGEETEILFRNHISELHQNVFEGATPLVLLPSYSAFFTFTYEVFNSPMRYVKSNS